MKPVVMIAVAAKVVHVAAKRSKNTRIPDRYPSIWDFFVFVETVGIPDSRMSGYNSQFRIWRT